MRWHGAGVQWNTVMTKSRELMAVPFSGKDLPTRMSEFSQPDISIGLTLLAYTYEGMRKKDIKALVVRLKAKLKTEMGPMQERRGCQTGPEAQRPGKDA